MLQRLFTLNSVYDFVGILVVDEHFDPISAREFRARSGAMRFDATKQIIRHADLKRAVGLAGENIDQYPEQF